MYGLDLQVTETLWIPCVIYFIFFHFTNLTHSGSNCVQYSIIRGKVRQQGSAACSLPSLKSERSVGQLAGKMSSYSAWESCNRALPPALHEMSPKQREIPDRRCGDKLWHKYLCCLAVGGRLWEDLSRASLAKCGFLKKWSVWVHGCQGLNPTPTPK